jgi:hypothetical protein
LPDLGMSRMDPAAAAASLVRGDVQETLPAAGVDVRTIGDPKQPSVRDAMGAGFSRLFDSRTSTSFAVLADFNAPRPVRVDLRYAAVGRGAGPMSVLYLARLGHQIPGSIAFKRGKMRNGSFDGEPIVASALNGRPRLCGAMAKLLREKAVYGNLVFTIKPGAEIVPDDDGAILAVVSAPGRRKMGFGGVRLELTQFLDLANGIDGAIASATGVTPARARNVPLPR